MDIFRREKVLRLILAQMYRARQGREDPINQVTRETIREELGALARASGGEVTEEETDELAGLINEHLNAGLTQFLEAARRVGEKLAPDRKFS